MDGAKRYGNHALLNYTPKFWHTLLWMNRYRFLHARIRKCDEESHHIDNFRPEHFDYFEGLNETKGMSLCLQIAYQKTSDHVFRPPLDMWTGMTRSQFQRCAEGAMECYRATGVVRKRGIGKSVSELVSSIGGLTD